MDTPNLTLDMSLKCQNTFSALMLPCLASVLENVVIKIECDLTSIYLQTYFKN